MGQHRDPAALTPSTTGPRSGSRRGRIRFRERGRCAVDGLYTPTAVLALLLLLLNDHLLKGRAPGLVTGKLSDLAGLVLFPLFLQGAVEALSARLGLGREPSNRVLLGCVMVTGIAFSALQLWPPAAEVYRWGLGALQWPPRALVAFLLGDGPIALRPVATWPDPTDLIALPALWVAWRAGQVTAPAALVPPPRADLG